MTVTYRRAADRTGGSGAGGSPNVEFDLDPCPSCDTRYDVRVDPREAVVVRVSGRTCRECNPHWRPPETPGGRRRVTIVPTQPSGGTLRIETLCEDVQDRSASHLPERVPAAPHREVETEVSQRADAAWQRAVAPIMSTVLAEADRDAVERAWRPEHCETLEAVAEALDEVWTTVAPTADETTVALRVVGLPAVTAGLVATVAARWTGREPIALTGELLRFTGVAICAGTRNAVTCGRLRHELETVTDVPDDGMVGLLETGFARALTATMSGITVGEFLGDLDTQPERVRIQDDVESVAEAPAGPIARSRTVTAEVLDGPSSTAIFGA
ncbi:hypothetical protein ABZ744_28105 [Micromonospora chersina]|uniref:hypothetical protein n=1 Tax=Micromonospora chersina TaxID=47854 RepID=UPI00340E2E60